SGSEAHMRKHPPLSYLACPVSPLVQKKDTIDSAMIFAQAGLPLGIATMPLVGGTAPSSQSGYIALGNAEILSLNCLIQLMYPGTGVYYALFSTSMNPYTGGCLSSTPNQPLLNTCPSQLAHFYGMPSVSGYGGVDENIPLNSLAMGHDISIDALLCYFTGPDMILNFGLTDNDTLCYPQRLVIDDYINGEMEAIAKGLDFDNLDNAVDEVISIGAGGSYIASPWSAMNLRNYWHKNIRYQWQAPKKEFRDITESAVEKAKWILDNHQPVPLADDASREMDQILAAADKELLK
ncbi:MAG: trimethylamine methyltransferase family protein, partial [Desulfobacterales bacterium]|nr:trimethylamine methyltransferase family protein [Desulfobacterales bacterium]